MPRGGKLAETTDSDTPPTAEPFARPVQGELPLMAPPAGEDELLVPARMVNVWVYCPRLAFLEWAQGEWAGNADTAAGQRAHRATEAGRAPALPDPGELTEDVRLKTRRLLLSSERLGLTAEIDVLEAEDGKVTPVDFKTGKRPHVAEGAYLPERVQVAVQAMLLREAGYLCDEGALWFADSRERVVVPLTDDLVAEAMGAASALRLAILATRTDRAADASELLGMEGEAAALYFRALPSLFMEAVAALPAFAFDRRNRRPPADPVNACLSLCYALLTRTFVAAVTAVGLDPWKGLHHVERPGRPALALVLIEP